MEPTVDAMLVGKMDKMLIDRAKAHRHAQRVQAQGWSKAVHA